MKEALHQAADLHKKLASEFLRSPGDMLVSQARILLNGTTENVIRSELGICADLYSEKGSVPDVSRGEAMACALIRYPKCSQHVGYIRRIIDMFVTKEGPSKYVFLSLSDLRYSRCSRAPN